MRQLDVGATLREAFELYRDQAGILLPVAFWLFLAVAIVDGLTAEELSLFWLGIVVGLAIATLYQGIVVGLVRDLRDGRRDSSVRDLIRLALPVVGPLLGAGILYGLGVGAGIVLLVVPGLYLATVWAVVAPVIVVERRSVFDAFGRSRQLVRGEGWQVFKVIVTAFLLAAFASLFFTELAELIASGPLVRIVFAALAATLTAPITALVASVLYFRLLSNKEEAVEAVPDPL
jgi:hypothetical protein